MMTPKERAAMQQALEALVKCNHFHDYEDEITALREALAEQAEQEPVAQQDSDDKRLLREIFMLCEATEELEPTNDFMRGRIFEAKGIRRGIGTWYQDTFCGRSYIGEFVLNAAPVRAKDLTDDDYAALLKECRIFKHQAQAVERLIKAKSRKQIDLTDEEIKNIANEHGEFHNQFARAVIAADRRKNK